MDSQLNSNKASGTVLSCLFPQSSCYYQSNSADQQAGISAYCCVGIEGSTIYNYFKTYIRDDQPCTFMITESKYVNTGLKSIYSGYAVFHAARFEMVSLTDTAYIIKISSGPRMYNSTMNTIDVYMKPPWHSYGVYFGLQNTSNASAYTATTLSSTGLAVIFIHYYPK